MPQNAYPFNGAQIPESVKAQILADQLIQKSAAENTPFTSRGVGLAKIGTGLLGGIMEGVTTRNEQQAQAAHRLALANALMPSSGAATPGTYSPPGATPGDPSFSPLMDMDSGAPQGNARDLAIRTIYGEAGGEPAQGQAGVASVLKNRLASGQYGNDMQSVIMAPKQFSLWNAGDPAGDSARRLDPNSAAYQKIGGIYDGVMSGQIADPTGGATHYYNPSAASPAWGPQLAKQNDVTIGNHRFVGGGAGPGQTAQADMPAPGATATGSSTLPPGITPDMVSGGPSPFGGPPQAMQPPQPSQAALAATLAGSQASPVPTPAPSGNDMPPLAADPNAPPDDSAPAATIQLDQNTPDSNAPPTPDASMMAASADPGVGNMLPATPPMPPPGVQSQPQGNPYGGAPQPMAAPLTISPQAMANALGQPQSPTGATPLSTDHLPGMDNFDASGNVTQSSTGGGGFTGDYQDGLGGTINGNLPAPQAMAGGPAPQPSPAALAKALSQTPGSSDDPAIRPFGQLNQASAPGGVVSGIQAGVAPPPLPPAAFPHPGSLAAGGTGQQAPLPQMAAANLPPPNMQPSPAALANALAPALGRGPALPQTGPMPPAGAQTMANAGVNPDAPAPGAIQAGPAPISPQAMAQALAPNAPQPMGLAGKSNGSDPMSPQNFQQQVALANALAPQAAQGGPSQSSPSMPMPAQGGAAAPQPGPAAMQSPQGAAPQASGGMFGGLSSLFGGQQNPYPNGIPTGQAAIDAAIRDPRVSPEMLEKLVTPRAPIEV